ncbi:MAG: VOC family protein [Bauldia sp.]|nr:VOC family protein [Bauldia sp.]
MASRLNPYLNFRNSAREAMEFYKDVFGGTLTMNTFGEFQSAQDPAEKDLIMHAQLETPTGFTLMGSDVPLSMPFVPGTNVGAISLSGEDEAELRGYWDKLTVGATITQPLEKAPWGDSFGMVTDRFGTSWMVNINAPRQ